MRARSVKYCRIPLFLSLCAPGFFLRFVTPRGAGVGGSGRTLGSLREAWCVHKMQVFLRKFRPSDVGLIEDTILKPLLLSFAEDAAGGPPFAPQGSDGDLDPEEPAAPPGGWRPADRPHTLPP